MLLQVLDVVVESYFDGRLYKNNIWTGTVEGQEYFTVHKGPFLVTSSACRFGYIMFIYFCFQAFQFILLSLSILVNSSVEDKFMESTMISNDFHSLAGQHLNYYFRLKRDLIYFIAMIGKQALL